MIAVDPPSLPEAAVRAIALYGPVALVVTLAAAIGRSLEHVNLAWAAASWTARRPAVQPFLQLLTAATAATAGTPGSTTTPGAGDPRVE